MKTLSRIYTAIIMVFLYAPIAVMIVFSFNSARSTSVFGGFSLQWYEELLHDSSTIEALKNTLVLAVLSSVIATVLGTLSAVGIFQTKRKFWRTSIMSVTNIPMMNPDIVTGISLMLLFVFVGAFVGAKDVLGFGTMLIAHITFNLPYVILSVLPKLRQTDPHLAEAARALGCTPLQAFFKVVFPSIAPGIFTGLIMAFTLSLDDFVISYFTCGHYQTLPIVIYNMTKKTVAPDVYALSTIIFLCVFVLLILYNTLQSKADSRRGFNV